jgi:hypothetical protein
MTSERSFGGWCGCASLVLVPIAYVILDDDITSHSLSSSWAYSLLFLVGLPIVLFHVVKWSVNGLAALMKRRPVSDQ